LSMSGLRSQFGREWDVNVLCVFWKGVGLRLSKNSKITARNG